MMFKAAVLASVAVFAAATVPAPQQSALLDIYTSTGGKGWKNAAGWSTGADVCTWFGVACDATGSFVEKLQLPGNGLVGTIPSTISALGNLTYALRVGCPVLRSA